ncbi:MAG: single-stranded DNA-binding protein [Burkholderiales bacterium]|nr:single-stranded DNA-binding protein [Burkholderiales bacterium]
MSASDLIDAARELDRAVRRLHFSAPVAHVYNPLDYAWAGHEQYLRRFGEGRKRVVFVGMNPGPFGMMQTGVPFGEIAAVRDWMKVQADIAAPAQQHPKRLIEGFACPRSEVSGRRLWGWAAQRFGSAEAFFEHCFVLNYCPLVFLEASGRNYVPEKLPAAELQPLQAACDAHLRRALGVLQPEWAIGVGGYAMKRIQAALAGSPLADSLRIDQILHPSPASPAANRGWSEAVQRKLGEIGCFDDC